MILPFMSENEIGLLEKTLKKTDRVWEWGSGGSTVWMAQRVKHVTAIEHRAYWAGWVIKAAPQNVSVLYVPPNLEFHDEDPADGDLPTFRDYVEIFHGRHADVILIDGRARVECARWLKERAPQCPTPETRIFLHDCERAEYEWIWKDQEERQVKDEDGNDCLIPVSVAPFVVVERVERLMLLKVRY